MTATHRGRLATFQAACRQEGIARNALDGHALLPSSRRVDADRVCTVGRVLQQWEWEWLECVRRKDDVLVERYVDEIYYMYSLPCTRGRAPRLWPLTLPGARAPPPLATQLPCCIPSATPRVHQDPSACCRRWWIAPWPFSIVPTVLAGMADPEGALRNTSDTSPFSDAKRIQDLLEAKLVKDEIAQREGGGGQKVSYIEAWRVIEKAQAIFGFDGWSSRVLDIQKEYEEQNSSTQRWSTGYSCLIRVSLKDGTFHDDVGFGSVVNERDRGKAIENARKEAVSDGVKRALRYYGAALGNCVYDKTHVRASLSLNSACFSQHRTGALRVPMRAVLTSLSIRPTQVKVATARPKPAMPVPQLPPPPGGGAPLVVGGADSSTRPGGARWVPPAPVPVPTSGATAMQPPPQPPQLQPPALPPAPQHDQPLHPPLHHHPQSLPLASCHAGTAGSYRAGAPAAAPPSSTVGALDRAFVGEPVVGSKRPAAALAMQTAPQHTPQSEPPPALRTPQGTPPPLPQRQAPAVQPLPPPSLHQPPPQPHHCPLPSPAAPLQPLPHQHQQRVPSGGGATGLPPQQCPAFAAPPAAAPPHRGTGPGGGECDDSALLSMVMPGQ